LGVFWRVDMARIFAEAYVTMHYLQASLKDGEHNG